MVEYANYTNREMQAITIAKCIEDGKIVIVGTGLPLIGASLAKRVFAPNCKLIVESGLMDCNPIEVPRSVGDNRLMAHCAVQWPNVRFVGFEINEWLHNSERLVAFIGGAQINPYGDVNSTCIGDYHHPKTRLTGSGGANGIAMYK
jgi:glutaconate CoA-transferase subunit B